MWISYIPEYEPPQAFMYNHIQVTGIKFIFHLLVGLVEIFLNNFFVYII